MSTTTTKKPKAIPFKAEVKQLLDLMIHSLYSQKEVFLRELLSNSSDAVEKRRLMSLENPEAGWEGKPEIWLHVDKEKRTLAITDQGIGMSSSEVKTHIGTIAQSGTKAFAENLKKMKDNPELIGKFGVGFYSAFMVADAVELHTQKVLEEEGTLWSSTGDGTYSTESKKRKEGPGTTVTLHFKPLDEEKNTQDFTDFWTLKQVVKKYSDFLNIPIKTMNTETKPMLDTEGKPIEGKTETKTVEETLNSMKALWRYSASKVKKEEYAQFYKSTCNDWKDPLETIHYKAEGAQEFVALIFIPSEVPFDFTFKGATWGLSLYVKKVFISEQISELLPDNLRFIKGVVDSDDIPLNVSREILQKDHRLQALSKAISFKVYKHFENLLGKNRSHFEKIWNVWGKVIKEDLASGQLNADKIKKIALFRTTLDNRWTTLDEYISRMKPEQKGIYYLVGNSQEQLKKSPYMEKIKDKGYEVLLLVDHVDEWVATNLTAYKENNFINLRGSEVSLEGATTESEEDKKSKQELQEKLEKEFAPLKEAILKFLDKDIKGVKLSKDLTESPVCLVSDGNEPSVRMEKIMQNMGHQLPETKRTLEINPGHVIIQKLKGMVESKQKDWIYILYHQALLNEGMQVPEPYVFNNKINNLMSELLKA